MKPLITISQKKLKPLAAASEPEEWRSAGVAQKPDQCGACKYSGTGAGFCGDDSPKGKRMVILCAAPTKGEILEQIPWFGAQGWLYTRFFLEDLGIPRHEVMISHVLRCRPPFRRTGSSGDSYPGGTDRRNAEMSCRTFDGCHTYKGDVLAGGIKEFGPDTFLVTFEPEKSLEVTAYKRIIQADIAKAWRLVVNGRRVCVLMGTPAFELVGGGLVTEGGVKTWRGHYWSGSWPFEFAAPVKNRFQPPKGRRFGGRT